MTTLARFPVGRILLHLLAMLGDRCVRFHFAGIVREISPVAAAPALLAQVCVRVIGRLVRYFARPISTALRLQPQIHDRSHRYLTAVTFCPAKAIHRRGARKTRYSVTLVARVDVRRTLEDEPNA